MRLWTGTVDSETDPHLTSNDRLNPDWAESLMGWPKGWSSPNEGCVDTFAGFPAGQGTAQFAHEEPRVLPVNTVPFWRRRIEMLGNGVVPQQVEMAYSSMLAV